MEMGREGDFAGSSSSSSSLLATPPFYFDLSKR